MSEKGFLKETNNVRIVCAHNKSEIMRIRKDFRWSPRARARAPARSKLFVIAEDTGRVIGVSCLIGVFNVPSVYVAEEYRNKGMGTALLRNAISIAKRKGYAFVMGSLPPEINHNIRAEKNWSLVKKCGFRKVVNIGKRTIIMCPLKMTTGKFALICTYVLLSLIPENFCEKIAEFIDQFM